MKPNYRLIEAFYKTAEFLESNKAEYYYNFDYIPQCNCGILTQFLLEVSDETINTFVKGYWSKCANQSYQDVCSSTGLPLNFIFRQLTLAGLEQKDFQDIEFCGLEPVYGPVYNEPFENRFFVANYFRSKAQEMEQQLLLSCPIPLSPAI